MSHVHLLRDVPLFWWRAWTAVMRPLIEDLGIFGILIATCVFLVRYMEHRWKKKSHTEAFKDSKEFFHDNVWTPLKTYTFLLLLLGFALGPYEIFQQDERRLANYELLRLQGDDLKAQNAKLANQVQQLTPKPERVDSLRRRTIRLADEEQKYFLMRFQGHPPFAYPDSRDPNPSQERKKEIQRCQSYDRETEDYYHKHFKERMIGIIHEYNSKGVKTGYLESDVRQRPPALYLPGSVAEESYSDDLYQFRELVYHLDAQDNLIVVTP
jgi:hypothetical protein